MIFRRSASSIAILAAVAALAGCPGQDDNSAESGIRIRIAEVHVEGKPAVLGKASGTGEVPLVAAQAREATGSLSARAVASATGGYAHTALENHEFTDNTSRVLSMYRMYLVVDRVELVPCASISQLPLRLLNSLIPTASAHAGHGAEPVGGRSMGKANVIDVVTRDEYYLPLGDLAVAPGRYCGAKVALGSAQDDSYGIPVPAAASADNPTSTPDVPNLVGKMFAMRADYCSTFDAGVCVGRTKVDIDDAGLLLPAVQTIDFATPLEVGGTKRNAFVAIGIAYGTWAHDVNVALLASDMNERQKFVNNMASSLHIYAKGLGDLPSNVSSE